MNLRPAGGTLRPGGHITRTMNLRRGCRPVTSAASRRRASGPSRPSRHVRASRRAAARSAPSGFRPDSALSMFPSSRACRPVGWSQGDLTGPGRLPLGAQWDRQGSFTGSDRLCSDRLTRPPGTPVRSRGKPRRQPPDRQGCLSTLANDRSPSRARPPFRTWFRGHRASPESTLSKTPPQGLPT